MALRAAMPLAFLVVAGSANAVVAFSNFGPGDSFLTSTGWTISGPTSAPGNFDQGEQFTAGATGSVSTIRLALQNVLGANQYIVALYDDAGDAVGNLMMAWSGVGAMGAFGSSSILTLTNPFPSVSLTNGNKYWLIASAADDAWNAWMFNDQGGMGNHAFSADDGATYGYTTQNQGAFEVNVVPEPASMSAIAAGIAAMALRRRRK